MGIQTGNILQVRLFDTPVLEFETTPDVLDDPFGTSRLEIHNVKLLADKTLLPYGLVPTPDGTYHWLETRALPFNRRYADKLCVAMGIRPGDVERIIEVGLGLSLNDSYWVVPADFDGAFLQYNLFKNDFSDALAAVAYTGKVDTSSIPEHGLTPELTTNGTLHKAWRIAADGKRLLYKGSSDGYHPGEWLSEVLASQIADVMGIDHTPYWHDIWNDEDCSVCACFCTTDISYVPFALLADSASMASCIRFASHYGKQTLEATCDMIAFDALICNTDRHFTNFGYLIDAHTNDVLSLAPIFDNGRSLFPNYGDDETRDATMLAQYCRPAFGPASFEELLARVIGSQQREKLIEVADTLELIPVDDRFAKRCQTLSDFLRNRAAELAKLPLVDHDQLMQA